MSAAATAAQRLSQLEEAEEVRGPRCAADVPSATRPCSAPSLTTLLLPPPQKILQIIEHAAAVAELLADVDGEKREEALAGERPAPQAHAPNRQRASRSP